jgi:hypothetical protein
MSQIQELHQQAMNLAESAAVARLRGSSLVCQWAERILRSVLIYGVD